ncbi:MAG: alkaline phosphatase family protein [Erysipelotrichaceae bacterium]
MIVKNDYSHCLTNLACSIQKYFGLSYKHDSLEKIDEILQSSQPENVILFLFDGMGSRIIKRNLAESDFFIEHQIAELTSVFPATTTAATTSVRTGLNPSEHLWLGWNCYLANIDQTITLFLGKEKESGAVSNEFAQHFNEIEVSCLSDQIKANGYQSWEVSPFGDKPYQSIDNMMDIVFDLTQKSGKKFIYVYDCEPDTTMHKYGPDSEEAVALIKQRNQKVQQLCAKLSNSVVIVVADHGHQVVEDIYLQDYPMLTKMLERTTSIETRACSFKVKPQYKLEFKDTFNRLFGKWFVLLTKEEIIQNQLFGPGKPHEMFSEAIGDYLAIAVDKYTLIYGDYPLYSTHAGYCDDEIYVPLIVYESEKEDTIKCTQPE